MLRLEPAAFTAVAKSLAHGLAGDEGDYWSVMVEAEAMLRELCVHTRSRDVMNMSELFARSEGAFHVCVSRQEAAAASPRLCVLLLERWWTRVASSA
jgi:hypothetical protein